MGEKSSTLLPSRYKGIDLGQSFERIDLGDLVVREIQRTRQHVGHLGQRCQVADGIARELQVLNAFEFGQRSDRLDLVACKHEQLNLLEASQGVRSVTSLFSKSTSCTATHFPGQRGS